ncbi:hypothetical protein EMCRGX_G016515 [Ephydatia muelleri]
MKLLITWLIVCLVSRSQALCSSNQFACSNGNCVPSTYQCDRYNDCADNSDEVGCVCYAGDIRLTGTGSTVSQGNVELCITNQFNAICGNVWSSKDAKVVCRQLGFNSSIATTVSQFGAATTDYLWTRKAGGCIGTESRLFSCPAYPVAVSCTSANPAAVICSSPYCPSTNFKCSNGLCIDTTYVCDGYNDCRDNSDETHCICTRGEVRVEGGPTPAQGTVGACFKNQWGAVCDTYWTDADAKVVCGQLGYTDGNAVLGSYYGAGSASSYWTDVGGCRGNESKITACKYTTPVLCYSTNHAGVSCYNPTSSVAAAIGGGVVGGILLLLIILCICVCICCLCKKSWRKGTHNVMQHPPQPAPAQTEAPSGGAKVIIIRETNPQNTMMPSVHYIHDPYYNTPQFEPYPAPSPLAMPPDWVGYPPQSYTDPNSYFQENKSAIAYEQADPTLYQNEVAPSAPPHV